MADPDVFRQRLTDAGLKDVRVERTAERPVFTSVQAMWDWVLYGNPIPGMLVADLSEDQRTSLRQALDSMVRERAGAGAKVASPSATGPRSPVAVEGVGSLTPLYHACATG